VQIYFQGMSRILASTPEKAMQKVSEIEQNNPPVVAMGLPGDAEHPSRKIVGILTGDDVRRFFSLLDIKPRYRSTDQKQAREEIENLLWEKFGSEEKAFKALRKLFLAYWEIMSPKMQVTEIDAG